MDLTINYYDQEYPMVNDVVFIQTGELKDGIVTCKILEYPNCDAIIQTSHLTKKKRVRSIRSFLSNKPIPAEVIDSDEKMVSLSIKFLTPKEKSDYEKDFYNRCKLLNLLKKISIENSMDFDSLIKQIIYPLNKILPLDNKIDFIENNYTSWNFIEMFGDIGELFKKYLIQYFKSKPKKFTQEFSIISSNGIKLTQKMFEILKEKQPEFNPSLLNTPTFFIEINEIEEIAQEKINKFLKDLTETCQELKVNVKY